MSQPREKATSAAFTMSAFVNVLLMTRRKRSEPVSGANVKPDFRTSETASARATEKASARSEGSEIDTRVFASSGARHATSGSICEESAEDSQGSPTSLQPASAMNAFVETGRAHV